MTTAPRVRRVLTITGIAVLLVTSVAAGSGASEPSAADSNEMTITAGEYTYDVARKSKPGNVELTFDNQGRENHELVIVAFKQTVTVKQVTKVLVSGDERAGKRLEAGAGVVIPLPALLGPGRSTTVIVNLKAGRYGIFCSLPTPDGTPHFAEGMVAMFDLAGSKSSFMPPTEGVSDVLVTDSAIMLPSSGMPKSGWIKVTNNSDVRRNLLLAEYLTPDATYETANAYFRAFFSGQATGPAVASHNGGVEDVLPGATAYFEVDLSSGRYALVSENGKIDDDLNELHVDFTVS
jgi:hypothetical protein